MSERKPLEAIITDIDNLLKAFWVHIKDPENLSQDILKLSVLNGGLGNYLAEAFEAERQAEATYKYEVDKLKLELVEQKTSATVAESKAKVERFDLMAEWLVAQHNLTVLKLKRQDTDSAIDAARSRLSLIKQDIRQS